MKTRRSSLAIAITFCAAAIGCVTYTGYQPIAPRPVATEAPPPAGGSDQPFYDDLSPYGRWVYASGPGWVWSPYGVEADWRPYLLGHWVFTDYGWTWASDEPWGWAVYHYGRWHQDAEYGWVWVPGTEWGPAWVAWHEGGGYVGWAPLPWQVRVEAGAGLAWSGVNVSIAPAAWCFVNARNLVDPGVRSYVMPPARNVTLVRVTQNVTNYTYVDNRVVNQGVRVETIGRALGHAVPHYRVAEADTAQEERGGRVRGQDFVVFRPDPRRGRASQGRSDPPGRAERERPHEFHPAGPDADRGTTATQSEPPSQAAAQPSASPAPREQQTGTRARQKHESRGRRFLDALTGQQPARPQGRGTTPSQAPSPAQATGAPTQASGVAAPSLGAAPQSAAPPAQPTRPEAARGQAAKPESKGRKNAPARGAKPKPNAPAPDKPAADKSSQGAGSTQ